MALTAGKIPANSTAARSSELKPTSSSANAANSSPVKQSLARPASPSDMPMSLRQKRLGETDAAQSPSEDTPGMDAEAWMHHANAAVESTASASEAEEPQAAHAEKAKTPDKAKAEAQSSADAEPAPKESAFARVPFIDFFKKINPLLSIAIKRIDDRQPGENAFMAGFKGYLTGGSHMVTGLVSGILGGPLMGLMSAYKNVADHSPDAPEQIKQQSAGETLDQATAAVKTLSAMAKLLK